jgi:hypothetical membrane protein
VRKALLVCGIIGPLCYVSIDVLAAVRYRGYHRFASQALSELSAVGSPTKSLADPLMIAFALLLGAFGVGVWQAARQRALRRIGGLLIGIAILCLVWPSMYVRGTGGLSRDLPHMVIGATVFGLVVGVLAVGSSLEGRWFPLYTRGTLLLVVVAGGLSTYQAIRLELGQTTPWIGIGERIGLGTALLWIMALAVRLIRGTAPDTDDG